MKTLLAAAAALAALTAGAASAATLYGPTPYLSQADAPFHPGDFDVFRLEDFEDGALNTPGLSIVAAGCITGTTCFVNGGNIDSVGNGGNPNVGHSAFTNGGMLVIFDANVLGSLPTFAGLVWTDGTNPISFVARDQHGALLGEITGSHADGSFLGGTGEDRFYGVFNAGGISRLFISSGGNGTMETDHIQFGLNLRQAAVPEPGTWAMMILGFAGAGAALRMRRRRVAAA
jgi:hypothetical protein